MGNTIVKTPLIRVNSNLPIPLYERIKDYASEIGMPITQTIILLLRYGLDYQDNIKNLSNIGNLVKELQDLKSLE